MHIVIDARIINSSTGRYIERLLHHLEQIDSTHTYTILVPLKDKDYWRPSSKNFTIRIADFANYSLSEQIGFKKYLDALSPDLVHFCMPQQPIMYKGRRVTAILDLTLLNTYSSDKNLLIYRFKQLIGRWVFKYVARISEQVITISDYTKAGIVQYTKISPEKISTIYLAGDTTTTKDKVYSLPFERFLLYVGAQTDYKNIKRLTVAHQQLLKNDPGLGLVFVGKIDSKAKINQEYFKTQGYKNITFTGFVDDQELNWLYRNCSAYIFPSLSEGFGLPGLEAMGCGAPVVSSNATCLPEVYGDAALYFDPLDTNDIARAIDEVLSNKKLRDELVIKGYKQVKKYSWEKMARETLDVYNRALKD